MLRIGLTAFVTIFEALKKQLELALVQLEFFMST